MPIYEYVCPKEHKFEKLFLTFKAAKKEIDIVCPKCRETSKRVEFSVPCPAMFLGNPEGWNKPSPTKRYSTKLVSSIEGNRNSAG